MSDAPNIAGAAPQTIVVELKVSADERLMRVLECLAHPLTRLPESGAQPAAGSKEEIYREAIEAARAAGKSLRYAIAIARKRGLLVPASTLRNWARVHGCTLPSTSSPAVRARHVALAAKAREALARKRAAAQGEAPESIFAPSNAGEKINTTAEAQAATKKPRTTRRAGEQFIKPPAVTKVTYEYARRWGAERGLNPYELDLGAVNALRAKLGLQTLEIER